jgi:hypothetical protein
MPVIFLKADAFLHSIVIFIPVKDDITLRTGSCVGHGTCPEKSQMLINKIGLAAVKGFYD